MTSLLTRRTRASERGQFLVIVAVGMVVLVALVGLVIDGGFAWGQQRKVQNGADSIAEAGATTIAPTLKGALRTDGDVGCAIEAAASANNVEHPTAFYTDVYGKFLSPRVQVGPCNAGGGAAIPAGAQGVKARADKTFDTFLARVLGFNQFTTSAEATAVTGVLTSTCSAQAGCAVLPVTFPITAVICDGTNRQIQIGVDWPVVQTVDPAAPNYADTTNEAIIPLCSVGPGAVGWLDLGCGNLSTTIQNPCNFSIPIPSWIQTQPGNTNSLDDELNVFAGPVLGVPDDTVVLIPINQNTCNTNPGNNVPDCPGGNGSGTGNNFYYYIPKFATFMIDRVYTSGNNPPECNSAPGSPAVGGNGATGCFKGWFTDYVTVGSVGPGATGPQDPAAIGIQLIR